MSGEDNTQTMQPEQDGSVDSAASFMSDDMVGGVEPDAPARSENGQFAKANAAGEPAEDAPAEHGDNDKPIKADEKAEDDDAAGNSAEDAEADESGEEDEDFVEIPASEEGAEPTRYSVRELVEAHSQLATTREELERAKEAQPLPSDYEIAMQETQAERQRYAMALQQWAQYNPIGDPPNKELLNQASQFYDPDLYYQQLNAYEQRAEQHAQAKAEHDELIEQNKADQEELMKSHLLRARDKISEFWPELKDPKENQRVRQELKEHYGITEERLATITDPEAYRVMKDAISYRRGEAKKPKALKAVTAKPKLVPAKARQAQKTAKAQKSADARRRFAKSHSVDDAADVMGDHI